MRYLIRFGIFMVTCLPVLLPRQSACAQTIRYTVVRTPWNEAIAEPDPASRKGEYQPTGPNLLGRHRAVIRVAQAGDVARLNLEWRRHDKDVGKYRFIIVNAETGDTVRNIYRVKVDNERCELLFGPVKSGVYHFYYLTSYLWIPGGDKGGYTKDYSVIELPVDAGWMTENRIKESGSGTFVKAACLEIQAKTEFDSFFPMEVIATENEKETLRTARKGENFLLFPEDRRYPIRMPDNIPQRWILNKPSLKFAGKAERNEYYAYQVGIWALGDLTDVKVVFSPLKGNGYTVPASSMTCFNTGGISPAGKPFVKKVDVAAGRVQSMWMGIDLPADIPAGTYTGKVTIDAGAAGSREVEVVLEVTGEILKDRGDGEPWRHSRLRWLNSTAGLEDVPIKPYEPIRVSGNHLTLTDKELTFAENGLPSSILVAGEEILASPVQFHLLSQGSRMTYGPAQKKIISTAKTLYSAEIRQQNQSVELVTRMEAEPDGWMKYTTEIRALRTTELSDIQLKIPCRLEHSTYIDGLKLNGRLTPDNHDAKWDASEDAFWIGSPEAGLYCELRGEQYCGPMRYFDPIRQYYGIGPQEPWYNKDKGGFLIRTLNGQRNVIAFTGPMSLKQGETVTFEWAFIITPVKKLDTPWHFDNRYYHNPFDPEPKVSDSALGVKVANVHHGTDWLPYISCPFPSWKEMKGYADRCHAKGIKAKIYYTTREISNFVPEIWAFRSLGDEIMMMRGPGGGYSWLKEHYVENYLPWWYHIFEDTWDVDAAVHSAVGNNRWHNYYIEDIRWMIVNAGIDGIYIDASLYDRETIKRLRRVMDQVKPGCQIDLHEGSPSPIRYLEYFPYIDRIWFGEGLRYNEMEPADWLVNVSGIPFGMMGEMLNMGGNPWRGMVYGMTNRYGWTTYDIYCDPTPIWKVWDEFGIRDSKMVGYWEKEPLVTVSDPGVKATAYIKDGKMLISLGSWAKSAVEVKLGIDFSRAGLNPDRVRISAPAIRDFQPAREFRAGEPIPVEAGKGWLLQVESK